MLNLLPSAGLTPKTDRHTYYGPVKGTWVAPIQTNNFSILDGATLGNYKFSRIV